MFNVFFSYYLRYTNQERKKYIQTLNIDNSSISTPPKFLLPRIVSHRHQHSIASYLMLILNDNIKAPLRCVYI